MLILTLRTDSPEAEIGFFRNEQKLSYETWQAHRQLAETLHTQIRNKLHSVQRDWQDINGIVVYKGPGSFTGLRIGLSVGNALAVSLRIPIIGTTGDDWLRLGLAQLLGQKNDEQIVPEYGSPARVTQPRK